MPAPATSAAEIVSSFVTFTNSSGQAITGVVDRLSSSETVPWIVVAPKYGETKKNNLPLAYLLAANGFTVLRFDYTNHVGESAGEMSSFTLDQAVRDLRAAVAFADSQSHGKPLALIANSLSARLALRVTATDPRVSLLISVVGVVNVADTLTRVYQEDVVRLHLQGRTWGINDVLGFPIHFENFLSTLVHSGLHTLAGTECDARQTQIETVFYAAERDAWVELKDVRNVASQCQHAKLVVLEGAMHDVRENAAAADRLQTSIIETCLEWGGRPDAKPVLSVERSLVMRQNRIERERLRQAMPVESNEETFWSGYLSRYGFFGRVDIYQEYVKDVGGALGPIQPRQALLDAGCGNGLFGVWVLRDLATRACQPPPAYVGIDLTHDGIVDAEMRHAEAGGAPLARLYGRADLDEMATGASLLAFQDGTFDKICCSLVLSYVASPRLVMRELARVLKPGGSIIVSSMRPFADLSDLYLQYTTRHRDQEELDSARALLNAAGRIKTREEQGYYTFFQGEELADLMAEAGLIPSAPIDTFGGQAVLVSAKKP